MTRAQIKRAERERKVDERERQVQQMASANVSKGLISAEMHGGEYHGTTASIDAFGNSNRKSRRRGVLYLRVSSEGQDGEDKVSLPEQRVAGCQYCETHDIDIVKIYCDVAPGRTKDRPEFQRMLADARKGLFDVIVCWKGDRLARAVSPANALLEALEGTDIELEAVQERIDKNYFVLLAWFGGMELENFRDRAIMGKRGRAKGGMIPCRRICFGYDVDEDGYPILDREAAETVKYIYRLYVQDGLGMSAIPKRLNLEGIPSSRGGRWGYGMVNTVLTHPAYMGTWHYGKTRYEYFDKGVKKTAQPEHGWIQVKVPKIIDENTWYRAQQLRRERRKNAKRNTRVFYLLQHRMYCEPCGRMMGCRTERRKSVRKDGKIRISERSNPLRYYYCYGQQRDGYNCRAQLGLPAQTVEDAVWSATERIVRNPKEFLPGLDPHSISVDKRDSLHAEIRKVERILDEENRAKRFVIRRSSLGKLSEEELDEQLDLIRERVQQNEEILSDLLEQENTLIMEEAQRERIKVYLSSIDQVLDNLTDEQRKELIANLYTRITIDSQNRLALTVALPGDPSTQIGV